MAEKQRYLPVKMMNIYFVLIWVETFALQLGQNLYNANITVYATGLGFSNMFAGCLAIPYLVGAVIARIVGGWIADHRQRREAMILGCGVFTIGSILYCIPALASFPLTMMIARGMHGFGYACGTTAYSAAVVDVIPPKKLAIGLGVNWTAQGVAQTLSGILSVVLVVGSMYEPLFIGATVFLIISVLSAAACNYEGGEPPVPDAASDGRMFSASSLIEKSALPYTIVVFAYYLGIAAITFYAMSLSQSLGFTGGGLFFTVCSVGMVVSNLTLVRVSYRIGCMRTLAIVYVLAALCALNMAFCQNYYLYLFSGLLYGIATGTMPVVQSETVRRLPVNRRAAGTSTLFLAMDLSMGIGPVIWGAILDARGYRVTYLLSTLTISFSVVLLVIVFRSMKRRHINYANE
ncbi:MAG: MFS transporter [Lachnospiraceae bacterium]|nr:MFS transporter [Lachnospiraceae bacterium]